MKERLGIARLWDKRDDRYAHLHHGLSPDQIEAVRTWRLGEALGHGEALINEARRWTPPARMR